MPPQIRQEMNRFLRPYFCGIKYKSCRKHQDLGLANDHFMKIGGKAKPESPEEMALVHHALENPIRREILILMNQGLLSVQGIADSVGENMLDYHLHRLEFAGLIKVGDGQITLTESGVAYGGLVKTEKEVGGAGRL